jgi:hypothetical protein
MSNRIASVFERIEQKLLDTRSVLEEVYEWVESGWPGLDEDGEAIVIDVAFPERVWTLIQICTTGLFDLWIAAFPERELNCALFKEAIEAQPHRPSRSIVKAALLEVDRGMSIVGKAKAALAETSEASAPIEAPLGGGEQRTMIRPHGTQSGRSKGPGSSRRVWSDQTEAARELPGLFEQYCKLIYWPAQIISDVFLDTICNEWQRRYGDETAPDLRGIATEALAQSTAEGVLTIPARLVETVTAGCCVHVEEFVMTQLEELESRFRARVTSHVSWHPDELIRDLGSAFLTIADMTPWTECPWLIASADEPSRSHVIVDWGSAFELAGDCFRDLCMEFEGKGNPEEGIGPGELITEEYGSWLEAIKAIRRQIMGTLSALDEILAKCCDRRDCTSVPPQAEMVGTGQKERFPEPAETKPLRDETRTAADGEACPCGLEHAADFAAIKWQGRGFNLTPSERVAFAVLHDDFLRGMPEVTLSRLYEEADRTNSSENQRPRDLFKTSGIWQAGLVVKGERERTIRLSF